jgi:glutaredoxin-related protein
MIKVYVMQSCPDCTVVKEIYGNNPDFQLIDIGQQARSLKEFLVLRDHHPAFFKVRELGTIGIPCFVREDGSVAVSLKHFDANRFIAAPYVVDEGASCSLDGLGC